MITRPQRHSTPARTRQNTGACKGTCSSHYLEVIETVITTSTHTPPPLHQTACLTSAPDLLIPLQDPSQLLIPQRDHMPTSTPTPMPPHRLTTHRTRRRDYLKPPSPALNLPLHTIRHLMSIQDDCESEPLTTRVQSPYALRNERVYFLVSFHPVFGFVREQSMAPAVEAVFSAAGVSFLAAIERDAVQGGSHVFEYG